MANQYCSDDFSQSSSAQDKSDKVDGEENYSELMRVASKEDDNAVTCVAIRSSRVTNRENYNGL